MNKFSTSLLFLLTILFLTSKTLIANGQTISCQNRYATLVNPVRGRNLWVDKTINPLINQYNLIKQNNFPATWLLQYDILEDQQLLSEIKQFNFAQEIGIFLEVSPVFAEQARVVYSRDVSWYSPKAVFLSGYPQSDRRRLIDKLFAQFKLRFGYYPKSAGAWWIDSYSLGYMKDKYGIKSVMIVADQKTTDNYGVWGQWWGVPYYPAKANILTPASNLSNKVDVVVIQWAQRDSLLAFGEGSNFSNYSLQANDYIRQGKDTNYFNKVVDSYLDCHNPIGQITVGLETGIESVGYINEYSNQLESLRVRNNLKFVTMSNFAKEFANIFPEFPKQMKVFSENSSWDLTPDKRSNEYLGETIYYNSAISFTDYFIKDNSKFLNRHLSSKGVQKNTFFFPWFLILSLTLLIYSYRKKIVNVWVSSMLFILGAFGLILRSYYQTGWKVYFGPELPYLEISQMFFVLTTFLVFWFINRFSIIKKKLWLLSLLFGLNFIIQSIRISHFAEKYYLGFSVDALRFIGISVKSLFDIQFINQDFPAYISVAFLKVNFEHLWEKPILAITLYPLIYLIGGIFTGLLLNKLPKRVQRLVVGVLATLFLLYLISMINADPRQIAPILLQ